MSAGFAIRRAETCGASEVDCGVTDEPYRACCPESSSCPVQYNIDVWPSPNLLRLHHNSHPPYSLSASLRSLFPLRAPPPLRMAERQRANRYQCCPSSKNCTAEIVAKPRCANETWDLFDNGGYFCCERGLIGYATTRNSDGCASPGHTFEEGEEVLPVIRAGKGEPFVSTLPVVHSFMGFRPRVSACRLRAPLIYLDARASHNQRPHLLRWILKRSEQ